MTNERHTCRTPALIPAGHSAEALGDLAAPCSLPLGHYGDHSNGLTTWARPDYSQRGQR
ncbi:hypothetical protein [Streptomyces sp. CA-106131]|uniref:hypothetical protein n=1 Tax=Streptomyces sp. CA-106131 TaxID=3240045 RepID=UPI003D8AD5D4